MGRLSLTVLTNRTGNGQVRHCKTEAGLTKVVLELRILYVEDNRALGDAVAKALRANGFTVDAFTTAFDAEEAAATTSYDAIVLDLGLPDRDGMELLEALRRSGVASPILLLTARDAPSDVIAGLNAGADDYLKKPFNMDELIARLRAQLRRVGQPLSIVFQEGNVDLDTSMRLCRIDGRDVDLSRREFGALELLMRRAGSVITKVAFEEALYGFGEEVSSNAIEVLVHRLRKRLVGAGAQIEVHTLRGIGYMLTRGVS